MKKYTIIYILLILVFRFSFTLVLADNDMLVDMPQTSQQEYTDDEKFLRVIKWSDQGELNISRLFELRTSDQIEELVNQGKISLGEIVNSFVYFRDHRLVKCDAQATNKWRQACIEDNEANLNKLQNMASLINKIYGSELINTVSFDTKLHILIKNNDLIAARDTLYDFPELLSFANLDDETPIELSYRLGNMEGISLCVYFKNQYSLPHYDEIIGNSTIIKSPFWQKDMANKIPFKAFNLNSSADVLFVLIFGLGRLDMVDYTKFSESLITNGIPLIIIGDGVRPLTNEAIEEILAKKNNDLGKFKKVDILLFSHGSADDDGYKDKSTKLPIVNFSHKIKLNGIYVDRTEKFFRVLLNSFNKKQGLSVYTVACQGGLSLKDAKKVFKDRNNVTVAVLARPEGFVSTDDANAVDVSFSSDPEILAKEVAEFPRSLISKYLINLYESNNVVGVYEDGDIYFTDDLLSKIPKEDFLEYLQSREENKLSGGYLAKIEKYGLKNITIFEASEFRKEDLPYTTTLYANCTKDQDKDFCTQTFGKPEFGLLQYHGLKYLQLCPNN
jgi:hypothetical protein